MQLVNGTQTLNITFLLGAAAFAVFGTAVIAIKCLYTSL